MKHKLSDRIWLRAVRDIDDAEKRIKLEGLVRFLARNAAEADFNQEAAENGSEENNLEKDL